MDTITIIKRLLKANHKTSSEFAEYLGMSKHGISDWLTNKSLAYYKRLPEIAEFLGVTVEYLITGVPTVSNITPEERAVIIAYRQHTEMQDAVKRLLNVQSIDNEVLPALFTELSVTEQVMANIKTLLEQQKKSQESLAKYIGVSKQGVSAWMCGVNTGYMQYLPKIAGYFGVAEEELKRAGL